MQHRNWIRLALALALLIALPAAALADYHDPAASQAAASTVRGSFKVGDVKVMLEGKEVTLDVPPHLIGSVLWVPVRAVAEAWGARVQWDNEKRAVHVFGPKGEHFLFTVGESKVSVLAGGGNGELASPTHIVKDRAQIPLQFLADHFGLKYSYDEATTTATVTS